MFGEPCVGDIWVQRAQIIKDERATVICAITDEHGQFNSQKPLSIDFFNSQYFGDPDNPEQYIKRVKILEIDEENNTVHLALITGDGNIIKDLGTLNKRIFMTQFHLP